MLRFIPLTTRVRPGPTYLRSFRSGPVPVVDIYGRRKRTCARTFRLSHTTHGGRGDGTGPVTEVSGGTRPPPTGT